MEAIHSISIEQLKIRYETAGTVIIIKMLTTAIPPNINPTKPPPKTPPHTIPTKHPNTSKNNIINNSKKTKLKINKTSTLSIIINMFLIMFT